MIYEPFKRVLLRLLKAPLEPPEPPAGTHASARVFRASPRYLRYRLTGVGLLALLLFGVWLVVAISAVAAREPALALVLPLLGAAFLALLFFVYVAVRIDYDMRYYIVTDRSIRIREGAWVIQEKTLTHANVQNLNVVQGPLERLFAIKSLAVDTAGGGGSGEAHGHRRANPHHFELAGLEDATLVRDLVLGHLRRLGRDAGLGDADDAGARRGVRSAAGSISPELLTAARDVRAAAAALCAAAERG